MTTTDADSATMLALAVYLVRHDACAADLAALLEIPAEAGAALTRAALREIRTRAAQRKQLSREVRRLCARACRVDLVRCPTVSTSREREYADSTRERYTDRYQVRQSLARARAALVTDAGRSYSSRTERMEVTGHADKRR